MDIEISVAYRSAYVIGAHNRLWRLWKLNAESKGVGRQTIKNVYDDWKRGRLKLLVPMEKWAEIQ